MSWRDAAMEEAVEPDRGNLQRCHGVWHEQPQELDIERVVLLTTCAKQLTSTCRESLATEWQQRAFRAVEISTPLAHVLLAIYMAAYLFEVPAWCWLEDEFCGDPQVVPRSPISSTLPLHCSRLLQVCCLCCFIGHTVAERYALGFWGRRHFLGVTTELFALLDVCVAMVNRYGLPPQSIYWSPLLRPFVFLGRSRSLRRFVANALPAMASRPILDLVLLQGLWLFVWAWFGLLLFGGSREGSEYFADYSTALLTLFTLFTTANFPDVMMIAYSQSRWVFAYFGTYLVMSLYVLFNVLLAALFNSYKARVEHTHEVLRVRSHETLGMAFELLEEAGGAEPGEGLGPEIWERLCARLWGGPGGAGAWEGRDPGPLFEALAEGGRLPLSTFLLVAPELAEHARLGPAPGHAGRGAPARALGVLHWLVDASVVLSLAATVARTHEFLERDRPIWESARWLQALHLAVCLACLAEAALRLVVLGRRQLLSHRWLVDLLLALACGALECLLYGLGPESRVWRRGLSRRALGRALLLLRAARVERVLWHFSGPRETLQMLLALLGTFRTAGTAMFFVFYVYGTLGVQVFGGRVRVDAPQLQRSDFATAGHVGYWANNFNDFASGSVLLFELMVVNNWYLVAGGLALVSPGPRCVGWLFCISFYFCMHIVILNVLVTSVVESYERIRISQQQASLSLEHLISSKPSHGAEPESLLMKPVHSLSGTAANWASLAGLDESLLLRERRASLHTTMKLKDMVDTQLEA